MQPLKPTPSRPHVPPTYSPARPDLAYPSLTTAISQPTDEYRETTETGIVSGQDLVRQLTQVVTPARRIPTRLSADDVERLEKFQFVTFKTIDPEDPRQWSYLYRWYITGVVAMAVVQVAFASSVISGDFEDIESEFGVSHVVVALSVSLMVVGFGVGPLLWSPLSELFGRRWCWLVPMTIYTIFNIPCALAPNIGALLACRFICGFFAAAPLTLAGGAISDVWDTDERGFAIALFAAAPYGGPVLGPIVGGFVGQSIGWRWTMWVNMIFAGVITLSLFTIPETFAPVILKKRAKRLREETGDNTYVTEQEAFKRSLTGIVVEALIRPFQMLVQEPILLLMSMYIALIYGLLYAFFVAIPVIFSEGYGFSRGITGLMFLPVLIGLAVALFVTTKLEAKYGRDVAKNNGVAEPEMRLPGMLLGVWFIPIAMFIMGWTSPPIVQPGGGNWVGPASAGLPFGFGMVVIYFAANAYLIDAFPQSVASALAAKTVVRSGAGAAMPLFITAMFHNITNQWGASTWGFISLAMIPIPFIFYFKGQAIRARSKRARPS